MGEIDDLREMVVEQHEKLKTLKSHRVIIIDALEHYLKQYAFDANLYINKMSDGPTVKNAHTKYVKINKALGFLDELWKKE